MGKKLIVLVLACAMLLMAFAGCAATPAASTQPSAAAPASSEAQASAVASNVGAGTMVGVSMPTKSLQRWNQDGANMQEQLEKAGYVVDLEYAGENDVATQVKQLENMITKGCKVLVIAAIDGAALGTVLDDAEKEDITVIAYDRLIRDHEKVDYYATFDNYKIGVLQAQYLVTKLGLDTGAKGPFSMEIFGGSPDDNNAFMINQGHMDTIQQYLDSGALVITSGQTAMDVIAIKAWNSATAQSRMDNLLTANYADKPVQAILSPNDSIAQGVVASLKAAGYGSADKPYPVLTGQDCDILSVRQIIDGTQSMSEFKDTRLLAAKVVEMVNAILTNQEVPVNDTESYDNGVKVVPSYLLIPVAVDQSNYKEVILDSGYYTEDQINAAGASASAES